MSRLVTIFILLTILRASTSLKNTCPPPEDIHPCKCQTVTPKDAENWVSCDKIESLQKLTKLVAALKGYVIHKFRLSKSDVGHIPSNLFLGTTISDIVITETSIQSFTHSNESPFLGLENQLQSLSLRSCQLGTGIIWERFYGLHSLMYLDLTFNEYVEKDPKWFQFSHGTLASLTLKASDVEEVSDYAFSKLPNLKFLDISENKLKQLKRSMFPSHSEIVILNLNNNELSSLPEDIFHNMDFLKRVYVMQNHLQILDEMVWRPIFGQLERIDIEDNPLKCDMTACWLTQYQLPNLFYGNCAEPEDLKERSLRSLNFWDIGNCTNPKTLLLISDIASNTSLS